MGEQWTESDVSHSYEFAYIYPKLVNVSCYFYDGNYYYRWEFGSNFDWDALTEMQPDEIIQRMETIKTNLWELKWKFCASIKK